MSTTVSAGGLAVQVEEAGEGAPLLYLHGIADLHGAGAALLPFHQSLAAGRRLIAPAHPGCADSGEDDAMESIDDVVFHYLQLADALGLAEFDLAGTCLGGWIAAELAVRHPERVNKLVLVGATGLLVPGQPIGDLFMMAQPRDGGHLDDLRAMLFATADTPVGLELFPDGTTDADADLLRYKMFRFASRIGFRPPYFYHPRLRERLPRYINPALVIQGADDTMVPPAHGAAYAVGLGDARLEVIEGAGHSPQLERPDEVAALIAGFLDG
jgi:pimeloyl-ACP methyl ester carboxylesterase